MRILLPLLCLFVAQVSTSLCGAEDLIILDNGQRISGVIISETQAEDGLVTITTGSGLLRFNIARIKKIEMSYETRRARVKDSDRKGLTELARWCRDQGMNAEALDLLAKAVALPGGEGDTHIFYLRLVDEIKGPEAAFPLYKNYKSVGGNDPTTLERLSQLEKVKEEWDNAFGSKSSASVIDRTKELLEIKTWMPGAPQYFNPSELQRVSEETPDGLNSLLQVTCKNGRLDKAAILLGMSTSGAKQSNFVFTAANTGKNPLRVGIAIKTGSAYLYHESEPVMLEGGGKRHSLSFNLKSATWKTEASKWTPTSTIGDIDQIREIQILMYNGRSEYTVFIDEISFQGIKDL